MAVPSTPWPWHLATCPHPIIALHSYDIDQLGCLLSLSLCLDSCSSFNFVRLSYWTYNGCVIDFIPSLPLGGEDALFIPDTGALGCGSLISRVHVILAISANSRLQAQLVTNDEPPMPSSIRGYFPGDSVAWP